jgi:integrase
MIALCKKAGVEYHRRRSWHAFRRSLVTDLLNLGVPEVKVYDFLRWSRREVIFKYYMPDPKVIDQEIFEVHPYLPFLRRDFASSRKLSSLPH